MNKTLPVLIYLMLLLAGASTVCFSRDLPQVNALSCDYRSNPLGVESPAPRLGWKITSSSRNTMQTAWQVLVADSEKSLKKNKGNIWDSGKVLSGNSIQVAYGGPALEPAKTYFWKVRVWDNQGRVSGWSPAAFWQMGLLGPGDWKGAKWIAYEDLPPAGRILPAVHGRGKFPEQNDLLPMFRRQFRVKHNLKKATIFICGLGHFELSVNGEKVGDHFLDPGWTKYDQHALYVGFDLTQKLKKGDNALGVLLGNGFYFIPRDKRYRKLTGAFGYPKLISRLVLEYSDGSQENIISDESWKTAPSPITYTSIYGGEDYNANLEQKGWDSASFPDSHWKQAMPVAGPPVLNAQMTEPLKVFEQFTPQQVTEARPGVWVYDMGQNASAIPALSVTGEKGAVVRLTPGELLNKDGTVNQSASGGPHYYEYTLKGAGMESWQPRFTYYGFRYLQIEGAVPRQQANPRALPVVASVKSLHVRNAAGRVGSFRASNEHFNKTHRLIDWAIKSNMVSVLTDCPHREKLGWLEENHLMGASVHYNYDIAALGRKIVRDMQVAQTPEGLIPDIAPEYTQFVAGFRDSPEWGSNGIIMPWYLYKWYGDKALLEESYPMMQRYAAYLGTKAKNHLLSHGLGDWFDIGPKSPGEAQLTPKALTATAIYYYDLDILSQVARLLNKPADEQKYLQLAGAVKKAFNAAFFNKHTRQYATGSQTANAMAVYMKLVEPQHKAAVVDNLVKEIRGRNNSLTAGDIGYRYVLRVLDEEGRSDVIFDMNSRSDVPGYGWQLAHGATALTESWQAYGFVSNNHFMLGHLMEWFYSGLGGIRPARDAIAYDRLEIRPQPVGDVTSARATYQTPFGLVSCFWQKSNAGFALQAQIPANSRATVYLPASAAASIFEGGKPVEQVKGITYKGVQNGYAILETGSGQYAFEVR